MDPRKMQIMNIHVRNFPVTNLILHLYFIIRIFQIVLHNYADDKFLDLPKFSFKGVPYTSTPLTLRVTSERLKC